VKGPGLKAREGWEGGQVVRGDGRKGRTGDNGQWGEWGNAAERKGVGVRR
jgi:hypothetical protein